MAKSIDKKNKTGMTVLLPLALVLMAAVILLIVCLGTHDPETPEQTETPASTLAQTSTAATEEQTSAPEATEPAEVTGIELTDGLLIHYLSSYAGIYMEDGSMDVVSDVMMLVLENTSSEDLQLAKISIEYSDFTAEFEVTNLPAGEKVVALEKNRHPKPAENYRTITVRNVVFFPETMGLQEQRIRITGTDGSLEVENISGRNIEGDIRIYYKHSASDLLYGGITYRVSIKGGLAAGEKTRVIAGHYTVSGCRILQVDCGD